MRTGHACVVGSGTALGTRSTGSFSKQHLWLPGAARQVAALTCTWLHGAPGNMLKKMESDAKRPRLRQNIIPVGVCYAGCMFVCGNVLIGIGDALVELADQVNITQEDTGGLFLVRGVGQILATLFCADLYSDYHGNGILATCTIVVAVLWVCGAQNEEISFKYESEQKPGQIPGDVVLKLKTVQQYAHATRPLRLLRHPLAAPPPRHATPRHATHSPRHATERRLVRIWTAAARCSARGIRF